MTEKKKKKRSYQLFRRSLGSVVDGLNDGWTSNTDQNGDQQTNEEKNKHSDELSFVQGIQTHLHRSKSPESRSLILSTSLHSPFDLFCFAHLKILSKKRQTLDKIFFFSVVRLSEFARHPRRGEKGLRVVPQSLFDGLIDLSVLFA
jgi:hypothetical protein